MSDQRIKIPRTSDHKIATTFKKLGEDYNTPSANVSALGFSHIGSIDLHQEPIGEWKVLLDHNSCLIDVMAITIGALSIIYYRGGNYPAAQKSGIFDEIAFNWNTQIQSNPTTSQKLDIIAFISAALCPFQSGGTVSESISEEQSQLLAIHHSTLDRLENLNEDLIRKSSEFRRSLEEQFEEKLRRKENEYYDKEHQIKVKEQTLLAATKEKEKELADKLKAIDDRNNTHVRREIRDRMLDDVKQRINQFGVSKTTENKRLPVFWGIFSLVFTFIFLLAWTGFEIHSMNTQYFSMLESVRNISSWGPEKIKSMGLSAETIAKASVSDVDRTHIFWLWARFTIFSAGLAGTILYYIRWANRWAEQHISSEFQLQQFYIDVNRANWLIESCLEWRKETESQIPKDLLKSITHGLFTNNQSEPERAIHPADELASALLGSASKLKLKVGENEIDFDKPKKIENKPIKTNPNNDQQ